MSSKNCKRSLDSDSNEDVDNQEQKQMVTRSMTKKSKTNNDGTNQTDEAPGTSLKTKASQTEATIPDDRAEVCPICLDPPVHPVTLTCRHSYCYLCAKGLALSDSMRRECSLCRTPIPPGYLKQKNLLERSRSDLEGATKGVNQRQWFYQGKDGWWKFEERLNRELEETWANGLPVFETIICGHLYVIDFGQMVQYRKDLSGRRRQIKRDIVLAQCKGVAGLVPKDTASSN